MEEEKYDDPKDLEKDLKALSDMRIMDLLPSGVYSFSGGKTYFRDFEDGEFENIMQDLLRSKEDRSLSY